MKRVSRIFISALTTLMLTSCGVNYVRPGEASQTNFSISFFKSVNALSPRGENVVVSPYSAAVALSMLAEGAQGQTRVELENALGGNLYRAENLGGDDTVVVSSANSLWINNNFSPRNRYVSLLQKDFDAFVDVENFGDPAAVRAINNWCSENTGGKISGIIDRLSPDDVLVLVNALYFNAPWENGFSPSATRQRTFYGLSRESEVKMMVNKGLYLYADINGFQIIQLPYKGLKYAMYVILPPEGTDMDRMLQKADDKMLSAALDRMKQQEVNLTLPRFRVETSMILNKSLQKMGISSAFTSAADFGGIAEMGQLSLSLVKQKCYIDVNESGTEAAAVTSAQIALTSARPVVKNIPFMNVNRPFVFLIADGENQNIMFAGKIVNL